MKNIPFSYFKRVIFRGFQRTTNILFVCSVCLLGLSCNTLRGLYCHPSTSTSECIEFKQNNVFEYKRIIDTGTDKGVGTYIVKDDKVVCTFTLPTTKGTASIEVKELGLSTQIDTFGEKRGKVYTGTKNSIQIYCFDKRSQKKITRGLVHFKSVHAFSDGLGRFYGKDYIDFNINNYDFPLKVTFQIPGYLEHEIVLDEKSNYRITADLVPNDGYNKTSGEKIFDRKNFLSKKKSDKISDDEKKERKLFIKQK